MNVVKIKRQSKVLDVKELQQLSKEDLIERIQQLNSHNVQLKNIIDKMQDKRPTKKSCRKNNKPFDFDKCQYRHVILKFFYLGWDYHGYVTQEDTINTIEHHLFEALTRTCLIKDRKSSNYHRCGRTDKGVSSYGQAISINLRSRLKNIIEDDLDNEIEYCKIINRVLPDNIQCISWCPVDDEFSARFDCKNRTYKYFFPKGNLDIDVLKTASDLLLGVHDFRNFCKMDVGNGVVEFVRNILSISIELFDQDESDEYSIYVLTINAKAFLWHQIRCIIGILFLIGGQMEKPDIIMELFDIDKNPRKPDYNLASEIPLNLFQCDYEIIENWRYDIEALKIVIAKLKTIWTFTTIKSSMIRCMFNDLKTIFPQNEEEEIIDTGVLTSCLIQGVRTKKYMPLMKRQKCESLEDKIQHFVKRSRLEVKK